MMTGLDGMSVEYRELPMSEFSLMVHTPAMQPIERVGIYRSFGAAAKTAATGVPEPLTEAKPTFPLLVSATTAEAAVEP